MTKRIPKNRTEGPRLNKDVWDDFFQTLWQDRLSKTQYKQVFADFEDIQRKAITHGRIPITDQESVIKCPEGRRKGIPPKDTGDAICLLSRIRNPAKPHQKCYTCSGPYWSIKDKSKWTTQIDYLERGVGYDKPHHKCGYNLLNQDGVTKDHAKKLIFDYLVKKHRDYKER